MTSLDQRRGRAAEERVLRLCQQCGLDAPRRATSQEDGGGKTHARPYAFSAKNRRSSAVKFEELTPKLCLEWTGEIFRECN